MTELPEGIGDGKMRNEARGIVLFKSRDGTVKLDVQLERETIWLSLNQLSCLFQRDKSVISRHLRNVFEDRELDSESVVAKNATTASDGKTYQVEYFNLDAIISVGYRVNSKRGTEFRIWATNVLKQHIVKGYSVNEKRLKALNQTLRLAADISKRKLLSGDEATALLWVPARRNNSCCLRNWPIFLILHWSSWHNWTYFV